MNTTEKYMLKSFFSNLFLTVIKIICGLISKSKTLLADGIHCLSDLSTDIIGIVGSKISTKEPDNLHPFGHGKAEYIASLFISVFVIVLGINIFKNSFGEPVIIDTYYIILVSLISIVVKYFVSSSLIVKGIEIKSNILITSGTESRYDVLSSFLAFVFILLSFLSKKIVFFKYADMIGSIVISLLTIKVGTKLFLENFRLCLGEVELNSDVNGNIEKILHKEKEIRKIRRITILKYGYYNYLIIDICMKGSLSLNKIYKIETSIKERIRYAYPEYKYITINIKPTKKESRN